MILTSKIDLYEYLLGKINKRLKTRLKHECGISFFYYAKGFKNLLN